MIGSRVNPETRRALRIDISAALLFTGFAGLHAVYPIAAVLTFSGAWLVGRELRVPVPAPALTP